MQFFSYLLSLHLSFDQIFSSALCSGSHAVYVPSIMSEVNVHIHRTHAQNYSSNHTYIRGAVKKFPEFLDYNGLVHLNRVLMVISIYKFCRGWAIQFGGSGETSVWDIGFSITITHAPSQTSLVMQQTKTTVLSGCLSEWLLAVPCSANGHQGDTIRKPWRTSNRMRWPNSGRLYKKLSAGVSNNGKIDGASVCGRKDPSLKVIR
jgi:hypothetical protein